MFIMRIKKVLFGSINHIFLLLQKSNMISILYSINYVSIGWIFFMLNFSVNRGKVKNINPFTKSCLDSKPKKLSSPFYLVYNIFILKKYIIL